MFNEVINIINLLLPKIGHLGIFGYWLLFTVTFLESLAIVGVFIPGAIITALFGLLAAQNYFDFGDLIWYAAAGAILGDILSFYLGKYGYRIFKPTNRIFKSNYIKKGRAFFKNHGPKSIFLGRFFALLRPNISFVAGLFKMDTKRFYFYNITSAFLWAVLYLAIGYFLSETVSAVIFWSSRLSILILMLVLFLVLVYLLRYIVVKRGKQFFAFSKSILLSVKDAILNNPDVRKLIKAHPLFFDLLRKRFDKNKFTGLALTLLALAFIYILSLYLGVITDILRSEPIVAADLRIEELFLVFRQGTLIGLFSWLTLFGEWQFAFVLSALIVIIFWLWQKGRYILTFLLTIIGSAAFSTINKLAMQRPRPEAGLYFEKSYSFPSGHTVIVMALYGFLIYYLWRNLKSWKSKLNVFFAGLVLIILVGFSRLYLGVHYLSDVWGGYLLGLLWLIIGITLNEWLLYKKIKINLPALRLKKKVLNILSYSLLAAICLFYIGFGLYYKPEISPRTEKVENQIVITAKSNMSQVFDQAKLSKYTETLIGTKQEPLNIIIIAKDENELINAFVSANWYLAETPSLITASKIAQSAIFNISYLNAPMTPSFWNAEVHNFGFEKPTDKNSVRQRHHIRFWKTNITTDDGRKIFVGTASLDTNIKWLIVHKIDPDIDTEREVVFTDLQSTDLILSYTKEQFVPPLLGKNFARDQFFTDGKTYIIELK
jgi:undecaprenyl-diphosphatase